MLRGFATINYWTDDMEAATRWHAELLGIQPYFQRPGPDGRLAYAEFRIGDYQHELGLVDRRFAREGTATQPGGVITYWHVDDVSATFERLLSMGAKEYQPITPRGDQGFVTAAVVDPFGNVLGIMYNPHYLECCSRPAGHDRSLWHFWRWPVMPRQSAGLILPTPWPRSTPPPRNHPSPYRPPGS